MNECAHTVQVAFAHTHIHIHILHPVGIHLGGRSEMVVSKKQAAKHKYFAANDRAQSIDRTGGARFQSATKPTARGARVKVNCTHTHAHNGLRRRRRQNGSNLLPLLSSKRRRRCYCAKRLLVCVNKCSTSSSSSSFLCTLSRVEGKKSFR